MNKFENVIEVETYNAESVDAINKKLSDPSSNWVILDAFQVSTEDDGTYGVVLLGLIP